MVFSSCPRIYIWLHGKLLETFQHAGAYCLLKSAKNFVYIIAEVRSNSGSLVESSLIACFFRYLLFM